MKLRALRRLDPKWPFLHNVDEYSISEFRNLRSLKIYDDIHISYKSKDKKFILHAMEALVFYRNNIKDCLKKMDEIDSEFSNLFQNIKRLGKHKNIQILVMTL